MTVVLAGLACGVVGVALAALVYERQLRRLARSLRERDAHSNTRLTVEAPGRGFAELAAVVNGQLDAAQKERVEALRRQREFQRDLASLSHDVRTPLMGAKGYVRLAQDARERPDGEEAVARHLAAAEARLDDMGALLDQLFAYAQASDPDLALDLRPVRVLPLLADVLVGHYPAFDERGWEPQVDFEDEALATDADPEALARIFENLVGNALRHGASTLAVRQRGRGSSSAFTARTLPAALPVPVWALPCPRALPRPWACASPRGWRGACSALTWRFPNASPEVFAETFAQSGRVRNAPSEAHRRLNAGSVTGSPPSITSFGSPSMSGRKYASASSVTPW